MRDDTINDFNPLNFQENITGNDVFTLNEIEKINDVGYFYEDMMQEVKYHDDCKPWILICKDVLPSMSKTIVQKIGCFWGIFRLIRYFDRSISTNNEASNVIFILQVWL